MRKIKFRGARLSDPSKWYYGYYAYIEDKDKHFIMMDTPVFHVPDGELQGCDWHLVPWEVDKETVGQQLNDWKDKNGKEIYEGDIVVFDDGDGWEVGRGVIKWEDFFGIEFEGTMYSPIGDSRVVEVIGNIHENPELLK